MSDQGLMQDLHAAADMDATVAVLLQDAALASRAEASLARLANKLKPSGMTDSAFVQRVSLLQLACSLIRAERDQLLDEFCSAWIDFRVRQKNRK